MILHLYLTVMHLYVAYDLYVSGISYIYSLYAIYHGYVYM